MRAPDALHRCQRDADGAGHRPARAVRGLVRRISTGQRYDARHRLGRQRRLSRLSRLVPQQPVCAFLGEALLPAPNHRTTDAQALSHRLHRAALRRHKHDLRTFHVLPRPIAVGDDRLKPMSIRRTQDHTYRLCHLGKIAWAQTVVNRLNGSEH